MIIRPQYMNTLKTYRDVPLVKILAGIRRCGKSTILDMLRDDLLKCGIAADHILSMRYTSEDFDDGMTDKAMYQGIKEQMTDDGRYYLLLDEVQEIDGWEKAVNSLLENANTDIYVTGSNSKLMSSEISTYLTGRYISIPVYTLSFAEYLDFKKSDSRSPKELLNEYLRLGGFPIVALGSFDERSAYQIVEGIYNSVITNDITKRHNIMNFDLFNRVVKYIVENVGKTFSANAIAKFLKSEGRSLSVEAVYNYLNWLEKAFVIYRCQRYDLQGKSVLKTQEKFYLADASLKYVSWAFILRPLPLCWKTLCILNCGGGAMKFISGRMKRKRLILWRYSATSVSTFRFAAGCRRNRIGRLPISSKSKTTIRNMWYRWMSWPQEISTG